MKKKVIDHTILTIVKKDGSDGVYYLDNDEKDIITILQELVEESQKEKAELMVHTLGLSYIKNIIINDLYIMGYDYIAEQRKKDMKKGSIRYRINDRHCFFIQIKTGYKSFVTFQGVDSVIALEKLPETMEEAEKDIGLYYYTRQQFLSGIKNGETRILYSSSSISKTMYTREHKGLSLEAAAMKKRQINKTPANVFFEKWSRPCVHGGFNMVSMLGRQYQGPGIVLDVNSLYPYIACTEYLPTPTLLEYGKGTPKMKYIRHRDLYYAIYKVEVSAKLKEDGIACILADGKRTALNASYLSYMEKRTLTLTQADRDLLYENYKVTYFRIKEYCIFRASNTQFKNYLGGLYEQKRILTGTARHYVKMLLNGLLGSLAKQVFMDAYECEKNEDTGEIMITRQLLSAETYKQNLKKTSGLCYINAAITSAARLYIIRYIKKHPDRFLYTDTDSIHLKGTDIPEDLPVSDKMGDFKIEHTFTKCIYVEVKNYMIVEDGHIAITVAGIPKDSLDRLYDGPEVEGIQYKAIRKCMLKQDLRGLYMLQLPVRKIQTDISTGGIAYVTNTAYLINENLRNIPKIKNADEKFEDQINAEMEHFETWKMWQPYREKTKAMIKEWADYCDKYGEPTHFENTWQRDFWLTHRGEIEAELWNRGVIFY